jgi:hypothetical protein
MKTARPGPVARRSAPSLFVKFGLPALGIGVGISILGWTNFYVGFGVVTVSFVFLLVDMYAALPASQKGKRSLVFCAGAVVWGVLAYLTFVSAPVATDIISGEGYKEGDNIYGINWRAVYSEVRIAVHNNTDMEYSDLEIYIQTNENINEAGIYSGFNQCAIGPDLNRIDFPHLVTPDKLSVPLFDPGVRPISAPVYRIRCDKLAARSKFEAVFAIIKGGPNPFPTERVKARWAILELTWVGGYRSRSDTVRKCFVADCGNEIPAKIINPFR